MAPPIAMNKIFDTDFLHFQSFGMANSRTCAFNDLFRAGKLCVIDTSDFFTFVTYKYFSDDLTLSFGVTPTTSHSRKDLCMDHRNPHSPKLKQKDTAKTNAFDAFTLLRLRFALLCRQLPGYLFLR